MTTEQISQINITSLMAKNTSRNQNVYPKIGYQVSFICYKAVTPIYVQSGFS